MSKISNLVLHNNRGDQLPSENSDHYYALWQKTHPGEVVFGPIAKHTWQIDTNCFERFNPRNDGLDELPDSTGFLLCENLKRSDNLVLLDAYGQERMRLGIPWQLTREPTPHSADYPSRFIGLTSPWNNPATGEPGKFAVLAWVEYAGDYAFELDWTTGQFLWGHHLERY